MDMTLDEARDALLQVHVDFIDASNDLENIAARYGDEYAEAMFDYGLKARVAMNGMQRLAEKLTEEGEWTS